MSGGRFDYNQHRIRDIADEIESEINGNEKREYKFSKKTIKEFSNAVRALRIAEVYAQRIDWLLSGDDGEESFHARLKAELDKIK